MSESDTIGKYITHIDPMTKDANTILSPSLFLDEDKTVQYLLREVNWPRERASATQERALEFIQVIRRAKRRPGELESFLQQYTITTDEGLALMSLAEALLRIPDPETADKLIRDKVAAASWLTNAGNSQDWLVKAAGLGLALSGATLKSLASKLGEPVIREAMATAMGHMGKQFVLGPTIEAAARNAEPYEARGYRMSYDMLGEGARTAVKAEDYFEAYRRAIGHVSSLAGVNLYNNPGVSVKLSALHPRYDYGQSARCIPLLQDKLIELCALAAEAKIPLTVDAEESERLLLSLQVIQPVLESQDLRGWDGFGLAVQAYQTRASALIDHLSDLAVAHHRRLQVRLVKGAYWDSEIKRAQELGLEGFPVFTRKSTTDLSFMVCAQKLLSQPKHFYPMLATHNAQSVAAVMDMARDDSAEGSYELQRLHGMGEALYDHVLREEKARVSVYAPVGPHPDLLPYLVRRLLENGANSSFVNRVMDLSASPDALVEDPVEKTRGLADMQHPKIVKSLHLYGASRNNSAGFDFSDPLCTEKLVQTMESYAPSIATLLESNSGQANSAEMEAAFGRAQLGFLTWAHMDAETRAAALERYADLLENHLAELMALCVREAGKTMPDAQAEIREAVDFCRYYAQQGRTIFAAEGQRLPGPTGEDNLYHLTGRGVFVCISPWNFPLAIFTGQITAALMAGNAVICKPAEQTPRIAMRAVELMHMAGIPDDVIQILYGDGKVGAMMVKHRDVAGVAFTGSTDAAKAINRALADKDGPIVPLIAETGGQNAMIVDSSALLEQVTDDVMLSAFGSAGQRCSALRVLYVQEDIADALIAMLKGALAEFQVGNPGHLSSDIGPVIDKEALKTLQSHAKKMARKGTKIAQAKLDKTLEGSYFAPVIFEIPSMDVLEREVFGPILHIIRYNALELERVMEEINASGYGLTFGVHSRIDSVAEDLARKAHAGNIYINRSMIGAIVGSQPFGGQGLSGTGPKAGGPHYLPRFAHEKVISIDTTAKGGNASLVSLEE